MFFILPFGSEWVWNNYLFVIQKELLLHTKAKDEKTVTELRNLKGVKASITVINQLFF